MEEIIEQVQEQNVDGDFSSNKFKDVDALKKAYERLQAEFTKRCQRVSELQGEIETLKNNATNDNKDGEKTGVISREEKLNIIKDFLNEIKTTGDVPSVFDTGAHFYTPPTRPKTVDDASKLVKELFSKNKEN